MIPSPLPPFSGLSYSAKAKKPLGEGDFGWTVKLPNSSVPSSILPLWFRSRARNAFRDPEAVQAIWTGWPSPRMSNRTPFAADVRWNPSPPVSTMTGEQPSLPAPPSMGLNPSPPTSPQPPPPPEPVHKFTVTVSKVPWGFRIVSQKSLTITEGAHRVVVTVQPSGEVT
jgi:hypothetical protein